MKEREKCDKLFSGGIITDRLNAQKTAEHLKVPVYVEAKECTGSTNADCRAQSGEKSGDFAICADCQTDGRGRRGKNFFSPDGGLYLSVVKSVNADDPSKITALAALATAEAIENVTGKSIGIKWINDLYADGKKVCGILCENISEDFSRLSRVIIGIGINVSPPPGGFPDDIKRRAGALFETPPKNIKNILCAEIINKIYELCEKSGEYVFKRYKSRLFMLGKNIEVIKKNERLSATAERLCPDYRLFVRYPSGKTEELCSGEVSLKTEE